MLILSRKMGERIRIGEDVWLTIIDIDRNKVRLGLDMPDAMTAMREELLPLDSHYDNQPEYRRGNGQQRKAGDVQVQAEREASTEGFSD